MLREFFYDIGLEVAAMAAMWSLALLPIRLPWSCTIERLFVTPRCHCVHHSVDRDLSNSNYGFLLTAWDRIFGTFTDPGTVADDEPLGLDYEVSKGRMVAGLPPKPHRGDRPSALYRAGAGQGRGNGPG